MRADVLLVEHGLATSRNRAQELIAKGLVFIISGQDRKPVKKASATLALGAHEKLEVLSDPETHRFVSRGGIKMQGALARTKLPTQGKSVLDIGISTGGFTDCLLQAGASLSVGVDVGHGQLHDRLKADPRVRVFEGINARDLSAAHLSELSGGKGFDFVVIDVSFISLTLVLPQAIQYLKDSGCLLALVKPQFEVGREGLGKNGIVKDEKLFHDVEAKIKRAAHSCGLVVEDYFESSIEGTDGNREFFLFARSPELSFGLLDFGTPSRELPIAEDS